MAEWIKAVQSLALVVLKSGRCRQVTQTLVSTNPYEISSKHKKWIEKNLPTPMDFSSKFRVCEVHEKDRGVERPKHCNIVPFIQDECYNICL